MATALLPPNPDSLLNTSITPEIVSTHGLLPEEYEKVKKILDREPTLTELGIFSVMWSEHCSYKNSRPLLKLFPVEKADKNADVGKVLVKAGEENAGVIDIGDGWAIAFKIESHNHPSAVEPFEGAATGVGGIIRDIFTMGARPVLLTNSLRFGELNSKEVKHLFRGVVSGISHYGNCMGIPNLGGDIYFDECYEGNPLVNALCLGVLKHDDIKRGAASGVGNPVYYVGAATGRDGLGGASFASKELTEESQADKSPVQKGDPFMEKLLLEACLEMMAVPGLVVGIQDMGAAGLTCSTCETASRGNAGIEIELDLVPQRESGMNSYEIMLSESQERMLVIIPKGRESEIEEVFEKWDLHAVQVGEVTDGDRMVVKQHGVLVADIPALSLTDDGPVYTREGVEAEGMQKLRDWTSAELPDMDAASIESAFRQLIAHPTIASKEWVWKQYDHMVMAGTSVEPGSDAGVVHLNLEGTEKILAISNDCNGRFCFLNPYRGGLISVVECVRNLVCSGARPLSITDNLNFGNPFKLDVYYTLAESIKGLAEGCRAFDLPIVGGNVSLYNETPEGAIDPTPVVSIVGIIESEEHITRQTCRRGDETLILLGGIPTELGGSQYLKIVHNLKKGDAPVVDLEKEKQQNEFVLSEIKAGRVVAAHDVSDGGLLVAVAEMLFGEGETYGAKVVLPSSVSEGRLDEALFGESQGRILLSVEPEHVDEVFAAAAEAGIESVKLASLSQDGGLSVAIGETEPVVAWKISEIRSSWGTVIAETMDHENSGEI
jgi:phosphoribosylformylglycinamidine synthase